MHTASAVFSFMRGPRRIGRIVCSLCVIAALAAVAGCAAASGAPDPAGRIRSASASRPSLEEMAGSMIMVGFDGAEAPENLLASLRKRHVGGIILFEKWPSGRQRNVFSPAQVRRLTASLRAAYPGDLLIAIDQEGGHVQRLKKERGFMGLPSAKEMGAMTDVQVKKLGLAAGQELLGLGISTDLAPVMDVGTNPNGPLEKKDRIFSSDPLTVWTKASAFAEGLAEAGVIPACKHFPGYGSAGADPHSNMADVTAGWSRDELIPFRKAVESGWPGMIMTAHVVNRDIDPDRSATLSPKFINGILRGELGWKGVVISDDLQMNGTGGRDLDDCLLKAVQAGNDILLVGNNLAYDPDIAEHVWQSLMRMAERGEIAPERIRESWARIERMKSRFSGGSRRSAG